MNQSRARLMSPGGSSRASMRLISSVVSFSLRGFSVRRVS